MDKFIKLKDKINDLSDFKFILLSVILCIISNFIFACIYNIFNISNSSIGGPTINSLSILILAVLIGPLIETEILILIVQILRKFIKYNLLNWIIVSLIFTWFHEYSIYYMIEVLPVSFIFNYAYIFYKNKNLSIYWIMAIIHILCNLISTIVNMLTSFC